MALGLSVAEANKLLDAYLRNTAYTLNATVFVKLHTADPGAAGTTAAAANTTRKQITMSAAASGSITNSADLAWTSGEVTTSEDYSHYSLWTASTAGTFLGSGLITANAVTAGDQFKILAGGLNFTFNLAA